MKRSRTEVTADFRTLSIGPVYLAGHSVLLRSPRIADAPRWRALRLRDRALIEPFWIAGTQDWESRHTEDAWIREVLVARHAARTRSGLSMVIEVDGRFSGQCGLTAIDMATRTAELGIWVESEVIGRSIGLLASGVMVDYGFGGLGLRRIVAPVATGNKRARTAVRAAGFHREAKLPAFVTTGSGERVDHDLWALDPDRLPDGGLIAVTQRRLDEQAPALDIDDLCHVGSRRLDLPRSVSALRSMIRYHLGAVLRLSRRHKRVHLPDDSVTGPLGLGLRRVTIRDALAPSGSARDATSVITPLRRGSWFAESARALAFHITLHHEVIGRAELVGLSNQHRVAEAVVLINRNRADVEITSEATRMLLEVGRSGLDLERISGATDPEDEFATAVAVAAGLHHQGRVADTAVRDGVVGDIDLWATGSAIRE